MSNLIQLRTLCGSLRAQSSNGKLLAALTRLAPPHVRLIPLSIADLPLFNPNIELKPPVSVLAFQQGLRENDGLLISSPEYARGVSGALKNALDWVVGGRELVDKPVALLNARPQSTIAHAALLETLRVMSTRVIDAAACVSVPVGGSKLNSAGIAEDPKIGETLRRALDALLKASSAPRG